MKQDRFPPSMNDKKWQLKKQMKWTPGRVPVTRLTEEPAGTQNNTTIDKYCSDRPLQRN